MTRQPTNIEPKRLKNHHAPPEFPSCLRDLRSLLFKVPFRPPSVIRPPTRRAPVAPSHSRNPLSLNTSRARSCRIVLPGRSAQSAFRPPTSGLCPPQLSTLDPSVQKMLIDAQVRNCYGRRVLGDPELQPPSFTSAALIPSGSAKS